MVSNTVATSQSSSVTFKTIEIRYSLKVSFLALLPHFKRPPDCGLWLLMCWTARNTGQSPSQQRSLRGSADLGSVDGTGKRSAWWRCSHQALMLLKRLEASVIWKRLCLLLLPPFLPPSKTNPNPLPFCVPSQTVCPWQEFASPDYSCVSSTLLSNHWKPSTLLFSSLCPASFIPNSFPIPSHPGHHGAA